MIRGFLSLMLRRMNERLMPVDQYGLMKRIVGDHIEGTDNIYNLRLFGIFGRYEYYPLKFISNVCCKAINDLPLTMRQDVYFDYLWIDDFLELLDKFINMYKPRFHTYNVCHGEKISLKRICEIVNNVSHKDNKIIICREGLANEYTGNCDRLKSEVGTFEFTGYEDSIRMLYDWYRENVREDELYKLIY